MAVVKDGKVILKKGYGVRELGKPDPVDTQTLFACASTTKAMTAACMGMLVDEGKVKWDDPVVNYLPELQLYDPAATREIKIRDLFIHDTGVGNADYFWIYMDPSSDDILKKLKDVKPSYSIRSSFIYQNIFYLAAGKVIEKVSGKPWDQFIRERIFTPLAFRNLTVKNRIFLGENTEYLVATKGLGDLLVLTPKRLEATAGGFAPGDAALISWQPDAALLLTDD